MKFIYFLLLFSQIAIAQNQPKNHYISGKITNKNNEPLFGANIILKPSYLGSTTDANGFYRIDNIDPGKYVLLISYIGYKSEELELYISETDIKENAEDQRSNFSTKLGLDENEEEEDDFNIDILKGSFHENINFSLLKDALETEQIVVSASKKKEKLIDAPITIAAVSEQQIRKTAGGDLGAMLKTVRGVESYQVGMGRTALNVRGFMSAFNGRFVSLIDGANYMEPTFYISYGNTLPLVNEDIERLEVVFGPSSALYGPNAHNGLLNVITKHPRDSQGSTVAFGSGSSNYQSIRARFATARGPLSLKFSLENVSVLDWKYERIFGQDYNMDGEITSEEDHEEVFIWNFFDESIPEVWDDKNNDGQWDHKEEISVMTSEFERTLKNTKANIQFFYDISKNTEFAIGHEHYFQSGYQPFDSGLNFINYTMGSAWAKIMRGDFFARIHFLRSTGTEYWNSDIAYLNMMRRGLTLKESVDKTKISDYVKTDVLKGDFQYSFMIKDIEFISGGDFSIYNPNSNRQFLNDKGAVSENENSLLADSTLGEDIKIEEFGSYLQATLDLPYQIKFVTALRYDKHSYYKERFSPRYAIQWNGLKSGNIRFSYNRAFQTPSIFNLHMHRFFNAQDGGNIIPYLFDEGSFTDLILNVNDPLIMQQINNGEIPYNFLSFIPMQAQFRGNKDGFIVDEETVIPRLEIETVDSYEFGIKKLFFGKVFLDASFFYSEYKNFISPLTIIHDFYPTSEPYIPEQVTHVGDEFISDYDSRNSSVVYSYISTSGVTTFGTDLMLKYNLFDDAVVSFGISLYDEPNFDDAKSADADLIEAINIDSVKNDTLKYFLRNSLKSYNSLKDNQFNTPTNKGFFSLSKDGLFTDKLWVQLTGNYTEKFDFISGFHYATEDRSPGISPNKIYENKGPIGGGWLFDLHTQYSLNEKVRFKIQLNNLLDQDGPRVVGTPPIRRNAIFEMIFNFI